MRKKHCGTAAEFIALLRNTNPLWGGQPSWDWGFRGQGNADWPLLPSVFRDGQPLSWADEDCTVPAATLDEQCHREYKLIRHFLYLADRVGLSVPGDAQHFRLPPPWLKDNDAYRREVQDEWPADNVLDTLAIAQHHGVPTRLLDISHDALIAAFFAADDARDPAKVKGATRLGVWAVDLSMVREAAAMGNGRLIHVTAPRAGNSFLHHQDGLFLLDRQATSRRAETGRFEPMDEVVDAVFRYVEGEEPKRRRYYRRCPASPMIKITAPVEAAMDILDLLDREAYSRARIMPNHDNVVTTLRFLRTLNAHRRARGAHAAVTLGPKYPVHRPRGVTRSGTSRRRDA
jgi:hypothetical protein